MSSRNSIPAPRRSTLAVHAPPGAVAPGWPTAPHVKHVRMGTFALSEDPEVVLTTTLGSCVAVCLHDGAVGLGGMNHFLLPTDAAGSAQAWGVPERYGSYAIESLINALIARGADRDRLSAKLFGGARMFASGADIGTSNGRFALEYLEREGIPVVATDLGGGQGRVVRLHPTSGRTMRRLVRDRALVAAEVAAETRLRDKVAREAEQGGSVELF